jgi:hypothetical protein
LIVEAKTKSNLYDHTSPHYEVYIDMSRWFNFTKVNECSIHDKFINNELIFLQIIMFSIILKQFC